MNQLISQKGAPLAIEKKCNISNKLSHNLKWLSRLKLIFVVFFIFLMSCNEEFPVRVIGKVTNAVTGDPIPELEVSIENIRCSGFTPAYCDHRRLMEKTNSKGEFDFSFFQDCESEIYAETPNGYENYNHSRFIYREVAGRDDDLTCNDRPRIIGDDGYYFEIIVQQQMYVDVYAVDDPNQELTSFAFNNEEMEIVRASHFQKRFKIDIESYSGEFVFTTNYRNPTETKEYISYNYLESDEIVYEVRY